jgi:ribosomal protein L27
MVVVEHRHRGGPMSAGLLVGVGLPVAGWSAIGPDHVVYAVVVQGVVAFGSTRHNKLNHPCGSWGPRNPEGS